MKKIVRLTEADLTRIVKKVIKEERDENEYLDLLGFYPQKRQGDQWPASLEDKDHEEDWLDDFDVVDEFPDYESWKKSKYPDFSGMKGQEDFDHYRQGRGGRNLRVLKRRPKRRD